MDVVFPFTDLGTFVEDSVKLGGIVYWLAFWSRSMVALVSSGFETAILEKSV